MLVWRGLRVAGMRGIESKRASAHCCRRQDACTEGRSAKRTLVSAFANSLLSIWLFLASLHPFTCRWTAAHLLATAEPAGKPRFC